MRFVKTFDQRHYKVYLGKIDDFTNGYTNVNNWVKNFGDQELNVWIQLINLLEEDSKEYYEEFSILLTILIKFFIIELDIEEEGVKLKNSQLEKIIMDFKYILYREYSNRNGIEDYIEEEYILLK